VNYSGCKQTTTSNRPHILVIDSGAELSHKGLKGISIVNKLHFFLTEEGIAVDDQIEDRNGHGTAVLEKIYKSMGGVEADYTIVKLFENEETIQIESLLSVLIYIYEHVPCDIINMSIGITETEHYKELELCMRKLREKGIVLIAAFDNYGMMSFPAAFDFVYGVDESEEVEGNNFRFVKNSPSNILMKKAIHRVAWLNDSYIAMKGTSFSTPVFTAKVAKALFQIQDRKNLDEWILEQGMGNLEEKDSGRILERNAYTPPKKAIVFPYNKEIETIITHDIDFIIKKSAVFEIAENNIQKR